MLQFMGSQRVGHDWATELNWTELYICKGFDLGHTSGFPYFLQFKSEFCNKEFMIWATVSSWFCFCWLYGASPSLAAKNIINLILVLTTWWCSCGVFSCVVGRGCLLWPVCSLGKTLLAFALLHFVLHGLTCLLLQVSLDFLLLHSCPRWWKGHLFLVLVLEGLVGLHRSIQLQLLQHYWLGHTLGLLWYGIILPWKQRSLCHFWDCTQVLHFGLFCWLWTLLHFF